MSLFASWLGVASVLYASVFYASVFYASAISAEELRVDRDRPYALAPHERQVLDVYAPASGAGGAIERRAVVVWIHGGGWQAGDKSQMQKKPRAFVEAGYVFIAPNRRFFPEASLREITADTARAIRWAREHAQEYGGDPDSIFVMGHSSGANLAALVATDARYLEAEGLPLSTIKGCVPFDGGMYDVPAQVAASAADVARTATYREHYGDVAGQTDLSPAAHVAKGRKIPPFLIFYIDHPFTKTQSQQFAEKLRNAEVPVDLYYAEDGKTHATLNSEIGLPDDQPTAAIFRFLERATKRKSG